MSDDDGTPLRADIILEIQREQHDKQVEAAGKRILVDFMTHIKKNPATRSVTLKYTAPELPVDWTAIEDLRNELQSYLARGLPDVAVLTTVGWRWLCCARQTLTVQLSWE